eukprot:tig00000403_g352.t1
MRSIHAAAYALSAKHATPVAAVRPKQRTTSSPHAHRVALGSLTPCTGPLRIAPSLLARAAESRPSTAPESYVYAGLARRGIRSTAPALSRSPPAESDEERAREQRQLEREERPLGQVILALFKRLGRVPAEGPLLPTKAEILRLFRMAIPESKLLCLAIGALACYSASGIAMPRITGQILDAVSNHAANGLGPLQSAGTAMLGVSLVGVLSYSTRELSLGLASERIAARFRKSIFNALLAKETLFFDRNRAGELTNRLSADVMVVTNSMCQNIPYALQNVISLCGGAYMLFSLSPPLAAFALGLYSSLSLAAAVYGRVAKRLSKQQLDALARATAIAEERIANVRLVRLFVREAQERERYAAYVDRVYAAGSAMAVASACYWGFITGIEYVANLAVLWGGGYFTTTGALALSIGELTSVAMYTVNTGYAMGGLSGTYGEIMRAVGASTRIFEILQLDAPPAPAVVQSPAAARVQASTASARRIAFEGVHFSYPNRRPSGPRCPDDASRPSASPSPAPSPPSSSTAAAGSPAPGEEEAVLEDFNLSLNPGESVALVGPSGSGKSTVVLLLARLYDPTAGRITMDGADVRELDPAWLREQVGVVTQEPVLFDDTIRENIRYGRPGASDADVEHAARQANAAGFIEAMPAGYDTVVGARGANLSAGQKQRVAIARALLKDAPVLVLDEPTSALDGESEMAVEDALLKLMRGRTTLMIAHRLHTIQRLDRTVVVRDGRVVEEGRFEELMADEHSALRCLVNRAAQI